MREEWAHALERGVDIMLESALPCAGSPLANYGSLDSEHCTAGDAEAPAATTGTETIGNTTAATTPGAAKRLSSSAA